MRVVFEHEYLDAPAELREIIGKPDWRRLTLYMHGNQAALWVSCWFDTLEVGIWIDRAHRHSPTVVRALIRTFQRLLKTTPVVICYTQQPRVERLVRRLGFKYVGSIPKAFRGAAVEMYYTTIQDFKYGSKHKRL